MNYPSCSLSGMELHVPLSGQTSKEHHLWKWKLTERESLQQLTSCVVGTTELHFGYWYTSSVCDKESMYVCVYVHSFM